jgi:hypothetical protein
MKLKLPTSVQVKSPNGETIEVSAHQVVEHVVRTGRALGLSTNVEGVRTGARILAALTGGDISQADLDELKKAVAAPSRGWVSLTAEVTARTQPTEENPAGLVRQRRLFSPSAIDLLPIVEGLLAL